MNIESEKKEAFDRAKSSLEGALYHLEQDELYDASDLTDDAKEYLVDLISAIEWQERNHKTLPRGWTLA